MCGDLIASRQPSRGARVEDSRRRTRADARGWIGEGRRDAAGGGEKRMMSCIERNHRPVRARQTRLSSRLARETETSSAPMVHVHSSGRTGRWRSSTSQMT